MKDSLKTIISDLIKNIKHFTINLHQGNEKRL
jgi:hypothetical protein